MRIYADLHLHSKYSRATSKNLDLLNLEKWGKVKGLDLIGTGDFTHPVWIQELKRSLNEDGSGILRSKTDFPFLLTTELSFVYTDLGKGRRIHLVVWAPDFATVDQINEQMLRHGRLDYDGRPIFNLSSADFVAEMKSINKRIEVIPAHIWTPWFGLFGSQSGFDAIEDCFKDQTRHIHALETGLSSDPPMNWRLSALDRFTLVSNSDSHSFWPWRIGREANLFDLRSFTYDALQKALKTREGMTGTIEVNPSYGKYHYDGHRNCNISLSPEKAMELKNICPVCKRPLTLGVLHRVNELADREPGFVPQQAVPFHSLLPLSELIALATGKGLNTKHVWKIYDQAITQFKTEFCILLEKPPEELEKVFSPALTALILRNRQGKIDVTPGYDGAYGQAKISADQKSASREAGRHQPPTAAATQRGLKDFFS